MALLLLDDLVVAAGSVQTFAQTTANGISAALLVGDDEHEPRIVNLGEIHLSNALGVPGVLFYFTAERFWEQSPFINFGLVSAVATNDFDVRALFAPTWGPEINNAGTIVARARYAATAIETADDTKTFVNGDTGRIEASAAEVPLAIRLYNGGKVENYGDVLATVTGAPRGSATILAAAVQMGAGGGAFFAMSIVNGGLIQASDLTASPNAFAIRFSGNAFGTIVNSGTIRGDYAIWELGDTSTRPSGLLIENDGVIEGRVVLSTGNDAIANNGRMIGNIELGIGADLWFAAGGTLDGSVAGGAGSDSLFGSGLADRLNGEADDDVLLGAGGADELTGGAGGDIFVYTHVEESTSAATDLITDFQTGADRIDLTALAVQSIAIQTDGGVSVLTAVAAGGTLTVRVQGALVAGDIILANTAAVAGTAGADLLHATAAGSVLSGGQGDDTLVGAAGDDRLDGGVGGDSLWGGAGNDIYVVDDERDAVIELDGQGRDSVEIYAHGYYRLPDHVEDALIRSAGSLIAEGNVTGNRMIGGDAGDQIWGGYGNDVIDGNAGADFLRGDAGADRLTGGAGVDYFVYRDAADSHDSPPRSDGSKGPVDLLTDFTRGEDKIDLSAFFYDPVTLIDGTFSFIANAAFTGQGREVRWQAAGNMAHVFVDIDGDRVADMHIIAAAPTLQATDFVL